MIATTSMASNGVLSRKRFATAETGGHPAKRSRFTVSATSKESVFERTLCCCGFRLHNSCPNELDVEAAIFQRQLSLALSKDSAFPKVVDDFLDGLRGHIDDRAKLQYAVSSTVLSTECDTDSHSLSGGRCASLLRLLLGVDLLQTGIIDILLEKLPEFVDDDVSSSQTVNMPAVIMNQLRWLDHVEVPQALSDKLLEILEAANICVQREIIMAIPEVVTDNQHERVAKVLKEMLFHDQQLTVPLLDALSNLNLSQSLVSEVRKVSLKVLSSADPNDLATIIRFILQSVTGSDALEVVTDLRQELSLSSTPVVVPVATSTPFSARNRTQQSSTQSHLSNEKQGELLAVQAIHSAVRFQKCVGDAWLKAIDAAQSCKILDIVMLLILHQTGGRHKAIETLIRSKIRDGVLGEEQVEVVFLSHAAILREYFSSILAVTEVLLRSLEPTVSDFAGCLYRLSFQAFDVYCQQEVIGSLVTHIGGGMETEVNGALRVLSAMVDANPQLMAMFVVFLKGLLDYLDCLSVSQLRQLFSMLSTLAFCGAADASHVADDMQIIIRKQLSNGRFKYKRMGVIGAVCLVAKQGVSSTSGQAYEQVVTLLSMVRSSCVHCPAAAALFYDELTAVVSQQNLETKIQSWICDCVVADFQDGFLVESSAPLPKAPFTLQYAYNLDEEDDGSVALNLMPLLLQGQTDANLAQTTRTEGPPSLLCMASHFALLQHSEKSQHEGSLAGIDAILGCPVIFFEEDILQRFPSLPTSQREHICTALFYIINWFREVVNAFANQPDDEMKGKVVKRLHDITRLQLMLEKCLPITGSFVPPLAVFDTDGAPKSVSDVLPNVSSSAGSSKRGRKGKGKKSASDDVSKTDEQADDKTEQSSKTPVNLPLSLFWSSLRELDLEVFCLLRQNCITKKEYDSEMMTKTVEVITLQPTELLFLLNDLTRKLDHSLKSSTSSRGSFLKAKSLAGQVGFSLFDQHKPREVVKMVVKLLPAICAHLEWAHEFFQSSFGNEEEDNDDVQLLDCGENDVVRNIYNRLLQVLATLFAWNGFTSSEHKDLLVKALQVLASRCEEARHVHQAVKALASKTFNYLQNVRSTLPDLSTATLLCRLLVRLQERADSADLHARLADFTGALLKKSWPEAKGPKVNDSLEFLLKLHISHSEDPLPIIETIAGTAAPELMSEDIQRSSLYPTLTRSSFTCYYRSMLEELVAYLRRRLNTKSSTHSKTQAQQEQLGVLHLSVGVFYILINLVKAFDARPVLGIALKYGRLFVEAFMRLGMPVLDNVFCTHKNDVQAMLKTLQQSTRCLHHFSGHSKVSKDIVLTNHVPALKKCLEAFVFRVKAMLSLNDCHEAFWIGNLKNRDIQGEEILSQASVQSQESGEGVEEEVDEDEEEEIGDESDDEAI